MPGASLPRSITASISLRPTPAFWPSGSTVIGPTPADRVALVEEVGADDPAVDLGDDAPDGGMRDPRAHHARSAASSDGEVPREAVLVVDRAEGVEDDLRAGLRVAGLDLAERDLLSHARPPSTPSRARGRSEAVRGSRPAWSTDGRRGSRQPRCCRWAGSASRSRPRSGRPARSTVAARSRPRRTARRSPGRPRARLRGRGTVVAPSGPRSGVTSSKSWCTSAKKASQPPRSIASYLVCSASAYVSGIQPVKLPHTSSPGRGRFVEVRCASVGNCPAGQRDHPCGVDDPEVAERLREVADLALALDVVLLRQQPEVVASGRAAARRVRGPRRGARSARRRRRARTSRPGTGPRRPAGRRRCGSVE